MKNIILWWWLFKYDVYENFAGGSRRLSQLNNKFMGNIPKKKPSKFKLNLFFHKKIWWSFTKLKIAPGRDTKIPPVNNKK